MLLPPAVERTLDRRRERTEGRSRNVPSGTSRGSGCALQKHRAPDHGGGDFGGFGLFAGLVGFGVGFGVGVGSANGVGVSAGGGGVAAGVGLGVGDDDDRAGTGRVAEGSSIARAGCTLGTSGARVAVTGEALAGAALAESSTVGPGSLTVTGCTWTAINAPAAGPDGTGDATTNGARPITTTNPTVVPTTV
jgi:hypothetical protein